MNDERLGKEIGAFYRETDVRPPDSQESARQVAARLRRTPQVKRRRWPAAWWLRTTHSTDTDQATEHQASPIPATNGHTPTVIGRTHVMFSPVKAITAGALVFALGGTLLIAQPFGQQGSVPGAATDADDPGPAAYVHGFMFEGDCCGAEVETYDDEGNRLTLRGSVASGNVKMDDARMSGAWEMKLSIDEFPQPGTEERVEIHWGELTITNDQGDWSGAWKSTYDSEQVLEETELALYELTGTGTYEGLSALLAPTGSAGEFGKLPLGGAIFPSPLPPDSAYDD